MRACCWLSAGALFLFASASVADAATRPQLDAPALLRAAVDSDELDLAALAARLGDEAVLTSLAEGKDSVIRLSAVRATTYLASPELALQPLAAIAEGRDSELAPAAARRVLAIARALALQDPSTRELEPEMLRAAEVPLRKLADSARAHAEVRLCAGQAAHLLSTLHGPGHS
jgi:hypothetical protein